jgi:predicted RNA-binding protein with PIN domain
VRTGVDLLVDGRNVQRSLWPNLAPERVLEQARRWAADRGLRAVVVFDGRAPGELVGEHELGDGSLVVGTGAESADDWLIRAAAERHADRRDFWLVTSDRALRQAASPGAARTIGGGSFARELAR